MSNCIVVSDKPLEGYENFIANTLKELDGVPVESICLVARATDGTAYSAHFNAGLEDIQLAAATLQADVTHLLVRANLRQYLEELEDEDFDETEDEMDG